MATTRLLGASRPLSSSSLRLNNSLSPSTSTALRCLSKAGVTGDKILSGDGERRSMVALKASVAASESVITSDPQTNGGEGLAFLLASTASAVLKVVRQAVNSKPPKLQVQMFLERIIVNCRFFTLFAVAGSLIGSVLCFIEGCFMILESYFQYFHTLAQSSDQGHVMKLLFEAIDMFLLGTVMLVFGMGLHVMFVGSKTMQGKGQWLSDSNLFGLFSLRTIPTWVRMQSVSQAKSRIGHAIMMILQVGVLEKFQSIPLASGLDLACAAGAILVSSACVFLLSRLFIRDSAAK
ncbi:hypothetical protein PVL29_023876 [Vitis rotundifolia]|uniref:Uncharacterized protein n=1 Tax=Vitis rotundifolia TaxID=103349 RepID=A0AA38YQ86_VITRO|nr:hypothetical protein PVL29_023876 [Vitis rotundifolia]